MFWFLARWHMREQREPVHMSLLQAGATLTSHWLPPWCNSNQSRGTTLGSPNVGFCDWPTRLAPLESAAAAVLVGGWCETVSRLNRCSAEAETLKFNNFFLQSGVKLNDVTRLRKHGVFYAKAWRKVGNRQLLFPPSLRLWWSRCRAKWIAPSYRANC